MSTGARRSYLLRSGRLTCRSYHVTCIKAGGAKVGELVPVKLGEVPPPAASNRRGPVRATTLPDVARGGLAVTSRTMPTAARIVGLMADLLGGPGLPIQPGTCAACLRARLAPHYGVPTPDRALELGYAFEIAYDARLPAYTIDVAIAVECARFIVGACRGDVDDDELIAEVALGMFAIELARVRRGAAAGN
jgi:hypothetical protein